MRFPDATAHDYNLIDEVLEVLLEKQITVSFLMTPAVICLDKDPLVGPGFEAYERITEKTNGLIIKMDDKDVAKTVEKLVDQFNPKHTIVYVVSLPPGVAQTTVKIDGSMSSVKFVSNATGEFYVMDPTDKKHQSTSLGTSKIIPVTKPLPGIWTLYLNSSQPSKTQLDGISEFILDYGFSLKPIVEKKESGKQPVKGEINFF